MYMRINYDKRLRSANWLIVHKGILGARLVLCKVDPSKTLLPKLSTAEDEAIALQLLILRGAV